jgi:hypothetical protein
VELDVVGRHAVHGTLDIGEECEGALRAIAHPRRKVGVVEELADVPIRAVVMVPVIAVPVLVVTVFVVCEHGDVRLCGGHTASQH